MYQVQIVGIRAATISYEIFEMTGENLSSQSENYCQNNYSGVNEGIRISTNQPASVKLS